MFFICPLRRNNLRIMTADYRLQLLSFQLTYTTQNVWTRWDSLELVTKTCCIRFPTVPCQSVRLCGSSVGTVISRYFLSVTRRHGFPVPDSRVFILWRPLAAHETFSGPFRETNDANNKRARPASEASWRASPGRDVIYHHLWHLAGPRDVTQLHRQNADECYHMY